VCTIDATALPWETPAAAQAGACTTADLAAFEKAIPTAKSDDDLKKAVPAACAACLFTDVSKPGWGPLPEVASSSSPQVATVNLGGCYELVTGSEACGKAMQHALDCGFTACDACRPGDQTAYDQCLAKAQTTTCKSIVADARTACAAVDASLLAKAQSACETSASAYWEGPITVMCITGP
jgi:hypothetical protein